MAEEFSREQEEKSIKMIQKVTVGIGSLLVIIGIARQWPIMGKTYKQFIEGEGYLALMVGLIAIILGFSVRLFTGDYDEEERNKKSDLKR